MNEEEREFVNAEEGALTEHEQELYKGCYYLTEVENTHGMHEDICSNKEGAQCEVDIRTGSFTSFNMFDVEVGVTKNHGGDAGHGTRAYVKFVDQGGTCMDVRYATHDYDAFLENVEIMVGGESEVKTLIQGLRFAANSLEEMFQKN